MRVSVATLDKSVAERVRRRLLVRCLIIASSLYIYTILKSGGLIPIYAWAIEGSIIALIVGWWTWKLQRRQGLPRSPIVPPLLAFLGSAALSTAISIDPRYSLGSFLMLAAIVLLFFFFCDLLLHGWRGETFVDALLLLGAVLSVEAFSRTLNWYLDWWQMRVPEYPTFLLPYRLSGVMDHPNLIVPFIYLGLPFAIVRLARADLRRWQIVYLVWLLGATTVLVFTRSRGGWVGATVAISLTMAGLFLESGLPHAHEIGARISRLRRPMAAVLACLAVFAILYLITEALAPSELPVNSGGAVGGRVWIWEIAWRGILDHPIVGNGLNTHGFVHMRYASVTREFIANHAHSIYVNILSEQGLVGLAALAWILLVGAAAIAKIWRPVLAGHVQTVDGLLIGVPAALGGYLAHGVFEVPGALPTNVILVLMIGAVGLHAAGLLRLGRTVRARWLAPALVLPLIVLLVLYRQNAGHSALIEGIRSGVLGDWPSAASALDDAVALDPTFAFYHAQRGYAYGVIADVDPDDESAVHESLASYATARAMGPSYVPDLLNAAWLLEHAGRREESIQLIEVAVRHGADWALPSLLLAEHQVRVGNYAEAERHFSAAFVAEPTAREMAACRTSAACRAATQRIAPRYPDIARTHNRAQELLAAGRPRAAIEALADVPIANAHALPWLDRAEAHLALGELAQARYAVNVASGLRPRYEARAARIVAAIELASGNTRQAIAVLSSVARPWLDEPATLTAWYRVGLPGTLLPNLDLLQRTPDDLAIYQELARLYEGEGKTAEAAWMSARASALADLLLAEYGASEDDSIGGG